MLRVSPKRILKDVFLFLMGTQPEPRPEPPDYSEKQVIVWDDYYEETSLFQDAGSIIIK